MSNDLQEAQAERELIETRLATRQAQLALAELDGVQRPPEEQWLPINESVDEWSRSGPMQHINDTTPRTIATTSPGRLDDRADGRNRTLYENEIDLSRIRTACRSIADSSSEALGARLQLTNYVIGGGFQFEAMPRDGADAEIAKQLYPIVQAVIDLFDEMNNFEGDLDREIFDRAKVDGEMLATLYPQADGTTLARQAEPEHLSEPPEPSQHELESWLRMGLDSAHAPQSWSFGVHTEKADVQTIYGYHLMQDENGANFQYLPAKATNLKTPILHHIKLNVYRNTKRGISDFYSVVDDIATSMKTRRNLSTSAALASAIAWILQFGEGVSKASVSAIDTGNRTTTRKQTTDNGQQTRNVTRYNPGTILKTGSNQNYVEGPSTGNAGNIISVMQATLRMIGQRWVMPEFMISGDASNGNYASIREAGTPFVKFAQSEQSKFAKEFREILWKVVDIAQLGGWFKGIPNNVSVRRYVNIKVTPPEVEQRDPLTGLQLAEGMTRLGYPQSTVYGILGHDYDEEQKLKEQEPTRLDPASAGALLGAIETAESIEEARLLAADLTGA